MRSAGRIGTLIALVGLLWVGPASGSNMLAFLKTGVDAGAARMGEAVSAQVDDASACFWNPAGISRVPTLQLMGSHTETFADLHHSFAAAAQPFSIDFPLLREAAIGGHFNGFWSDDIDGFDAQANPTATFGYADMAAGACFGTHVGHGLRLGLGWNYLQESIGDLSATSWAVDLGLQWDAEPIARACGLPDDAPLRFGVALRNLGPQTGFVEEIFDLPRTIQGGAALDLPIDRLSGAFRIAADLRQVRDEDLISLAGLTYTYDGMLSIGFGYQNGLDTRDIGFGLGIQHGRFALDWAFIPVEESLGDENRFSLRLDL